MHDGGDFSFLIAGPCQNHTSQAATPATPTQAGHRLTLQKQAQAHLLTLKVLDLADRGQQ